ncbi:hypothetical protein [Rhodococcus sp. B50]|uniref:hypothetical protein n=1 Tax=Rhodococcus sp. B50 TaxID=2682847 RepID=UPI001BD213F7|nr:hypothetical protein [Rhodococcus sp. B50]MBS9371948.1 hypothetical protein [Rhodococcus sp. B50]
MSTRNFTDIVGVAAMARSEKVDREATAARACIRVAVRMLRVRTPVAGGGPPLVAGVVLTCMRLASLRVEGATSPSPPGYTKPKSSQ